MVKSHVLGTKRCSKCCQKTTQSKVTTDFHRKHPPHVQIFAYSILGRIEAPLEHWQPEEQHGFKNNRRIEEHLLTATKVIDKTLFANTPFMDCKPGFIKNFEATWWLSSFHLVVTHAICELKRPSCEQH